MLFTSDLSQCDLSRNNSFCILPRTALSISTDLGKKHFNAWKRRKEQEFIEIQKNHPKRIQDKLARAAQRRSLLLCDFYDARLHQQKDPKAWLSYVILLRHNDELKVIKNYSVDGRIK